MAKYVKLCTNPKHSVKGPRGNECPACRAQKDHATAEWLDYARTDCVVLLQRIQDAFFEGWSSYATPASAYNSPEEAWEDSEAKKVYDTLKQLWATQ